MAVEWLVILGIGLGALLVGGAAGYFLGGRGGGAKRVAELEDSLEAKEEEINSYRAEVYAQFSDTADKFKQLDESYNALHRQLATSAVALCGDQATPLLTQDGADRIEGSAQEESVVEVPDDLDGEVVSSEVVDEAAGADDADTPQSDEAVVEAQAENIEKISPADEEEIVVAEHDQSEDAESVPTLTETAELAGRSTDTVQRAMDKMQRELTSDDIPDTEAEPRKASS